ncbi:DSS1/SEM1 family-domain-containing protein [Lipomyces arxii]|uniref:DSS1/SEM1 family-domain-containing protein n=1 Tax=Lipomyces arxii TaxID=56418 RepID=UPI0034CEB94B
MAGSTTDKADKADTKQVAPSTEEKEETKIVTLEEDDEFEDFPVEDWPDAEAEIAIPGGKEQLWEENWDDDDADDDFSHQLREELRKASVSK